MQLWTKLQPSAPHSKTALDVLLRRQACMARLLGLASAFHRSACSVRCAQSLHQKQATPALRNRHINSTSPPSSHRSSRTLLHRAPGTPPPCLLGASSYHDPLSKPRQWSSLRAGISSLHTATASACGQQEEEEDAGYMREALQLAEKVTGCMRPLVQQSLAAGISRD